ncbi:MAG: DNA translocase FtsK 4TM domain-containing protein [Kiritimatiellae bacterium]|nr:DNA translocase FtsK 4TM domain-containing protein [Kiritimatiellia bacterium]
MKAKRKNRKKRQLKVKTVDRPTKKAKGSVPRKNGKTKSGKRQNVKVKSPEDRLYWKLSGVGMIALSVFLALALATFDWECVSSLTENVKPQTNLIGSIGNWLAYCGYVSFGLAVWCFPFALLVGGLKMLEPIPKEVDEIPNRKVWIRIAGLALMMLAVTGIVQLAGKWGWVQDIMSSIHVGNDAGGWVGRMFMTECLERGIAAFGATFLSFGLLLLAMCMALGLSTVRRLFDWRISEWDWSWFGETADAVNEGKEIVKKGIEKISPKKDEPPAVPAAKPPKAKVPRIKYPVNAELPPLSLLDPPRAKEHTGNNAEEMGAELMKKLKEFGVVATLSSIVEGPTVTQFAVKPGHGVRVEKFLGLSRDLQLALKAKSLRVFAPIPGQEAVGIQVSNPNPQPVLFREIVESDTWQDVATWPKDGKPKYPVPILLGKDVAGESVVADLTKMPHLLVAGASGKGKSVCLNSIINGLLMTRTPEQLRMILVDPKRTEFSNYKTMPHLLVPVVVDVRKVLGALRWAAKEMEQRLIKFSNIGARDIMEYNDSGDEKVPYIVIIIDELADIMTLCGTEVTPVLGRLMALARATGIHLILATQRPDVKTISGTIKANIPGRVALGTSNATDSRTILDEAGAELLCAKGDMLYKSEEGLVRTQGSLITKGELSRIMEFIVKQWPAQFDESIVDEMDSEEKKSGDKEPSGDDGVSDEEFHRAYDIVVEANRASASMLQQRMGIGYNHASRIMHLLEKRGVIGPMRGAGPREVLVGK